MIYQSRATQVEAVPVVLAGSKLMAVAVDGAAHLVPADSFGLFFRPEETVEVPPVTEKVPAAPKPVMETVAKKQQPAKPPIARSVAKPGGDPELSTLEAVMKAVAEHPRTQAEAQDRACDFLGWNGQDKKLRERVYQSIWLALKNGKLAKRTDPNTQLSHLYIVSPVEG